jgi:hypothetical protein
MGRAVTPVWSPLNNRCSGRIQQTSSCVPEMMCVPELNFRVEGGWLYLESLKASTESRGQERLHNRLISR